MSLFCLVLVGILIFLIVSVVQALTKPNHWINEGIENLFSSYDNSGSSCDEVDYTQEDDEALEERSRRFCFGSRSEDD